jgi:hypothetical protein
MTRASGGQVDHACQRDAGACECGVAGIQKRALFLRAGAQIFLTATAWTFGGRVIGLGRHSHRPFKEKMLLPLR